jgi:hypothetical protein
MATAKIARGAAMIDRFTGATAQKILGNGNQIATVRVLKTTGTNLTFGDSVYCNIFDSTGGAVFVGNVKADTAIILDSIAGAGALWVTTQAIQRAGSKSGYTGTLNIVGTAPDTFSGTWGNVVLRATSGTPKLSITTYGNYSVVAGAIKPAWISRAEIRGNYDTTGMGAANWSNRPETSVVASAGLATTGTSGGGYDTLTGNFGAAAGLYGRVLYGTAAGTITRWWRTTGSTVKIAVTTPAHAAGSVTRTVYDQYGGSAAAANITYSAPVTTRHRNRNWLGLGLGIW